ncbi:MAG: Na+/H+ antiporter subunit E [Thiobacillaceae bacterium]
MANEGRFWHALAFALVWRVLTEGRTDGWAVGAIFVAIALAVSLRWWPAGPHRFSLAGLLAYAGFFLIQSVRGGFQVAAMALRPRLALAPAMIEIPLRLPPGPAAVLLTGTPLGEAATVARYENPVHIRNG